MQAYHLHRGQGPAGLERCELPTPPVGPHDVRVRVHAVSLNHRDLTIAASTAPVPPHVPLSDGAGVVVAVGEAVTRLAVGQRVMSNFFPRWADGPPTPEKTAGALGGRGPGLLAEEVVLPESAWVVLPDGLDFRQAATLPCAGVTAWNALFGDDPARPGDTVLALGTGGVSLWALQLGRAAGLRMIVTSSDEHKRERALALGAFATINHRSMPDWAPRVRELAGGRGVDRVLETAGRETLARSMAATRHGGTVAVIGGTSGWGGEVDADALIDGALRLRGVLVGSRAMAESLLRFVETAHFAPLIDRVFPFGQARQAYEHLAAQQHFGKVLIEIG
ncbi:zinc-dependent alcohol dehydrogenase family protein [Aquabacterium humicola]|uniref:zinc-dependent alcohol dehydrogenase family protein n=1 Tax=Aquabacterium humicola TaxID=3237377 RepID=UPI0025436FCA|nr:NAD(P)-dependent alcohol dehydrogenase [Rubrivivax pictus]